MTDITFVVPPLETTIRVNENIIDITPTDVQMRVVSGGREGPIGYTGSQGIIGSTGFTGSRGTTGAQGPSGGPIGYVGSQGFVGSAGGGTSGPIGYTGSQGAQGPQGANAVNIWNVITDTTITTSTASVTVVNLGTYTQILAEAIAVTASVSAIRRVRISTDNGATYLATTATYNEIISGTGAISLNTSMLSGSASTNARSGVWWLQDPSTSNNPKFAVTTDDSYFLNTGSSITAIEYSSETGNLTGGRFVVYGK